LTLCAVRVGLAALVMVPYALARGHRLPRDPRTWGKFTFMGVIGLAVPFSLFAYGETVVDSGVASIINGTMPLFTLVIAHYFAGDEPITRGRAIGMVVSFAGIVVLFYPEAREGLAGNTMLAGMAVTMLAPICYASSTVFARRMMRGVPSLVFAAGQLAVAAPVMAVVALAFDAPWRQDPGWAAAGALVFLSILGTATAIIIYFRLLKRTSATFVSLVTYIMPPAGLLLGIVFLSERPGWNAPLGCALIVAGVVLVNLARPRKIQPVPRP
jgi:drug/metabolite transporter (DMT)-like permease